SWADPTVKYGIPVVTPSEFTNIIETFFLKEALWYYRIDDTDGSGRKVTVRSLLEPNKPGIRDMLKSKGVRGPRVIRGFKSSIYLSLHLFASIYLEGLHLRGEGRKLTWCMYPGHKGAYTPILNDFVKLIATQFHEQYIQDLILRHKEAIHTSSVRYRIATGLHHGPAPSIDNQLRTIRLNPQKRTNITDRTVIVIDDFTTRAYSFETARNFLLNAGAKSVICICIGKYPNPYYARSPKDGVEWDSFSPASLTDNDFIRTATNSVFNDTALESF
ncbi:MAG TPA: phosphoribosyltransferase, partial [Methylomirabilota bacterium]|nr:phosphoribosyltransferase [Methylomirabilota bacterium]